MKIFVNKLSYLTALILLSLAFPIHSQNVYKDPSNNSQLELARKDVLEEKFSDAILKYSDLVKKSDNKTVSAEYAFALALAGCYDGAIVNLDKIISSSKAGTETLFYVAQVLRLMEYDKLADVFWTPNLVLETPLWLAGKYNILVEKHKHVATINTDNLPTALQRANKMVAQKQYVQPIVLYEELVETYPDEYLPYIGASALWESLGYRTMAIEYLEKGIEVMGDDISTYDADGIYKGHLEKLKADNRKEYMAFRPQKLKYLGNKPSNNMAYFGLTFMNKTFALNARYGYRTSDNTNLSVDVGLSKFDGSKMFNTDFSYNATFKRLYVAGAGLSTQWSGGEFDGGLGLRAGLSMPLPNNESSIDILLSDYYMFKNKNFRLTLSIGFTRYF